MCTDFIRPNCFCAALKRQVKVVRHEQVAWSHWKHWGNGQEVTQQNPGCWFVLRALQDGRAAALPRFFPGFLADAHTSAG
jgi:hypothetical protein